MKTNVNKEFIENYFETHTPEQNIQFLGRALVVVFDNQTEAEKQANITNRDNGAGFTGADARSGCLTAKYFLKHGMLADWQFDRWTKRNRKGIMRFAKYWKQLDSAAKRRKSGSYDTSSGSSKAPTPAPTHSTYVSATPQNTTRATARSRACIEAQAERQKKLAEKAAFAELERRQEALAYMREEGLAT